MDIHMGRQKVPKSDFQNQNHFKEGFLLLSSFDNFNF